MRISIILAGLLFPLAVADKVEPCSHDDIKSLPFCDTSLPASERAMDLVKRLTLEEKIQQMGNSAPGVDRLHVPAYQWWTESLHGVAGHCTKDGRCATSYPMPIGLAAAFNREGVKKMASQISSEGRRLFVENEPAIQRGTFIGLDFWAPNINIFRDPRW